MLSATVRSAVERRLLNHLAKASGTCTTKELAQATASEEAMVVRLMRVLSSQNIVAECGPYSYQATPVTHLFALPATESSIRHTFDVNARACLSMPQWLVDNGFRQPARAADGPLDAATGKTLWQILQDPHRSADFNCFMQAYFESARTWLDMVPVESLLAHSELSKDNVLLVDVGGGNGQMIRAFRDRRFSSLAGRLVLQDRADVIAALDIKEVADIEVVAHDIFGPQTIKGSLNP